jgi:prevent-host-death family protein
VSENQTISASEANRSFSRLLREIQNGRTYIVTAHGRPVARIVPLAGESEQERRVRAAAIHALIERVRSQPAADVGEWEREELYET